MLYEISEDEYMERLLSNISGVPYSAVRLRKMSVTQKQKVIKAWESFYEHGQIHNCRFTVMCPKTGSVSDGIRVVRPLNYDLIIWDMITLMTGTNPKSPGWESLGEIARVLKIEANAQRNVHIALAQLNPDMQVKYSRAIEEHANNIWGWRYGEEEEQTHVIPVSQLKSRGSEPFDFRLTENFSMMRISDYVGGSDEEYTPSSDGGIGMIL